jgi:hypothetical protein
MNNEKLQKYVQIALVIAGTLFGALVITPRFHMDAKLGAGIGSILGIIMSILLFPDLRKAMTTPISKRRMKRIQTEQEFGFQRAWSHPTRIPFLLGLVWFVGLFIFLWLFHLQINSAQTALLLLSPSLLLFGLSGFLALKRNEYIDNHGRRYRGFWAIFNGTLFMLVGWGGVLFVLYLIIFDIE